MRAISFASIDRRQPFAARGLPVPAGAPATDLVFMRSCEDAPITNSAFAAIATKGALKHA